jgi:hypothetical protein
VCRYDSRGVGLKDRSGESRGLVSQEGYEIVMWKDNPGLVRCLPQRISVAVVKANHHSPKPRFVAVNPSSVLDVDFDYGAEGSSPSASFVFVVLFQSSRYPDREIEPRSINKSLIESQKSQADITTEISPISPRHVLEASEQKSR